MVASITWGRASASLNWLLMPYSVAPETGRNAPFALPARATRKREHAPSGREVVRNARPASYFDGETRKRHDAATITLVNGAPKTALILSPLPRHVH
jgi:hypothetical protein